MNVVNGLDSSSSSICQYPCRASKTAKHFAVGGTVAMTSFGAGNGCVGLSTNSFNLERSTVDLIFPFGFDLDAVWLLSSSAVVGC